jgi:DNA-directed RNA polymerase alpha subunit
MPSVREKVREEIRQRNERERRVTELVDAHRQNPDFAFPDDAPLAALKPVISTRSFNCLRNEDLETVGQVRKLTLVDLLRIPNLGRHSAAEITRIVSGGHDWDFRKLRKFIETTATPEQLVQLQSELEKLAELAKEARYSRSS